MPSADYEDLQPATPASIRETREHRLSHAVQTGYQIMVEHGAVSDGATYPARYQARYRAQTFMKLLIKYGHVAPTDVRERTWADGGAWRWAVQHLGGTSEHQ